MLYDLPIEIFYVLLSLFAAIIAIGLITRQPVFLMFAGVFLLLIFIPVTNLTYGHEFVVGDSAVSHYDVSSSTGQVLINSVTAHSRGERLSNTSSMLEGDTITCITVWLGRSGSPDSNTLIQVGVMDTSANFIQVFGSMNVTQLITASNQPYEFCLPVGDSYTFISTETVGIKWNDGDGTNTLTTRIDANNPFDGSNTEHVHATAGSWIVNSGQDIMMVMSNAGSEGEWVDDTVPIDAVVKVMIVFFAALIIVFAFWVWNDDYGG